MGFFDLFRRRAAVVRRGAFPRPWGARGFNSAKSDRLASGWLTKSESINSNLYESLNVLRARSRDSYLNNDFVRRFVSMVRTNVVGARGVTLQARSVGVNGKPDTPANDGIESAWSDWGRPENCDLAERLSWVRIQLQAITSLAIDGEILARHVVGRPAGGKYGYRLQMLDPESLDVRFNDTATNGNLIRLGVEIDANGKPVAYHLRQAVDPARGYTAANGRQYIRVPAAEIVHAFQADHVGQLRGYPPISTAMGRLKMLDGYFEAAITAARAGAAKMGFLTTPDGDSYSGDGRDGSGNAITDFESGTIEELPAGTTFTGFDPRYPHEQFGAFVKTCLQTISGSLGPGVSYTALSGDLEGVNFSSIRTGVLEEREAWKALQEFFIDAFCVPVFERWLTLALSAGQIYAAGIKPAPLKAAAETKYRNVTWQARRWSWVDPAKDMSAALDAVANNVNTISAVIRDQGRDPDTVFAERALELEKMRILGILPADVAAMVRPAVKPATNQGTAVDDEG